MKRGYTLSEADAELRRRHQIGRVLGLDEGELLALGEAQRRGPRRALHRSLDEEGALPLAGLLEQGQLHH